MAPPCTSSTRYGPWLSSSPLSHHLLLFPLSFSPLYILPSLYKASGSYSLLRINLSALHFLPPVPCLCPSPSPDNFALLLRPPLALPPTLLSPLVPRKTWSLVVIPMATETIKSSAHKEVSGAPLPPKNNAELGVQNPNDRDKQTGSSSTSARPPTQQQQQQPQRRLSPFVITGRSEEKHLGISARNLALSDFALLRTLGTGESGPCHA